MRSRIRTKRSRIRTKRSRIRNTGYKICILLLILTVAELAGVCRPGGGRERAVGHHGHAREQQHAHIEG
jgi:hypothetical protein